MAYYSILCHTIPYYSIIRETGLKSLFHKPEEAKIQRLRKNIFTKLSSLFSCFCEIVHLFIYFIFDQTYTVQNM